MFKLELEVRDNEIDIQGIVNHANYIIYMAHARHKYLNSIGIDFSAMALKKQNFLLVNCNVDFKKPLQPNDKFYVTCDLIPDGKIKIACKQEMRLIETNDLLARGVNTVVCVDGNNKNKPYIPDVIQNIFESK